MRLQSVLACHSCCTAGGRLWLEAIPLEENAANQDDEQVHILEFCANRIYACK